MLQAVLEEVEGDVVNVATVLAYPVTDCVLLAVGVGALAGTGWRLDRTWALLAAGILASGSRTRCTSCAPLRASMRPAAGSTPDGGSA